MTGIHGLEPLAPQEGVQKYRERRKSELSQSTIYEHTTRLNRFLEWCEQAEIEDLNSLSSRKVHDYMTYRQSEVAPTTLENEMRTLRLAIEIWENLDAVVDGLSKKVQVPTARKGDRTRDVKIGNGHAQDILKYMEKYEYATLQHVIFALLWHTGCRTGGLRALDLHDFYPDRYRKPLVEFVHRPESGTPLKNDRWGEREVFISESVGELLEDYIKGRRHQVTDEHGRDPLLTTKQGRPQKTTIQRNVYQITRPCVIGRECPDERDPEKCEAMGYNTASKCPGSVSPHAIRRGFVTHMRDQGADFDTIGDRVDATAEVLREHYDTPTTQEKRERQLEWVDKL